MICVMKLSLLKFIMGGIGRRKLSLQMVSRKQFRGISITVSDGRLLFPESTRIITKKYMRIYEE